MGRRHPLPGRVRQRPRGHHTPRQERQSLPEDTAPPQGHGREQAPRPAPPHLAPAVQAASAHDELRGQPPDRRLARPQRPHGQGQAARGAAEDRERQGLQAQGQGGQGRCLEWQIGRG